MYSNLPFNSLSISVHPISLPPSFPSLPSLSLPPFFLLSLSLSLSLSLCVCVCVFRFPLAFSVTAKYSSSCSFPTGNNLLLLCPLSLIHTHSLTHTHAHTHAHT